MRKLVTIVGLVTTSLALAQEHKAGANRAAAPTLESTTIEVAGGPATLLNDGSIGVLQVKNDGWQLVGYRPDGTNKTITLDKAGCLQNLRKYDEDPPVTSITQADKGNFIVLVDGLDGRLCLLDSTGKLIKLFGTNSARVEPIRMSDGSIVRPEQYGHFYNIYNSDATLRTTIMDNEGKTVFGDLPYLTESPNIALLETETEKRFVYSPEGRLLTTYTKENAPPSLKALPWRTAALSQGRYAVYNDATTELEFYEKDGKLLSKFRAPKSARMQILTEKDGKITLDDTQPLFANTFQNLKMVANERGVSASIDDTEALHVFSREGKRIAFKQFEAGAKVFMTKDGSVIVTDEKGVHFLRLKQ